MITLFLKELFETDMKNNSWNFNLSMYATFRVLEETETEVVFVFVLHWSV